MEKRGAEGKDSEESNLKLELQRRIPKSLDSIEERCGGGVVFVRESTGLKEKLAAIPAMKRDKRKTVVARLLFVLVRELFVVCEKVIVRLVFCRGMALMVFPVQVGGWCSCAAMECGRL